MLLQLLVLPLWEPETLISLGDLFLLSPSSTPLNPLVVAAVLQMMILLLFCDESALGIISHDSLERFAGRLIPTLVGVNKVDVTACGSVRPSIKNCSVFFIVSNDGDDKD
jgi:hypothetical protein